MSSNFNSVAMANNKIKDNKSKKENTTKEKDNNINKPYNVTFYCETCKRIPLIIFSEKSTKIVKYCEVNKKTELINSNILLNMINIKHNKKKDIIKENPNSIDNNINCEEFMCNLHGKEFINYCEDCDKNICYSCSKEHFKHKVIYFSQLLPSNKDIREGNKILAEMKRDLDKFKNSSKEIIKICESLISVKEIILNNLKMAMDFKRLNFYSIINYKNLLKSKIKLIEKPYTIINPLSEINFKILKSIQKNFEISINEKPKKENDNKDILIDSYNNFKNIINESFELNKDNNYVNINKIENNNDIFQEKSADLKNKNYQENINNNNINNYLNLFIKNDITFPFINNSNFETIRNIPNKIIDFPLNNPNNSNQILSYFSQYDKSTIMNINDINFIINVISSKLKEKIKKLYLCYRGSLDGDSAEMFHKKCDFFKNMIILIKTKDQRKFGGYSTESWETNSEYPIHKKDKDAFIFSLDNYNIFNVIRPENALYCGKKLGPVFGIGEIFIAEHFFKNISHCNEKEVYKCFNFKANENNENNEPLSGEKEFYVEEMEAYKVDF